MRGDSVYACASSRMLGHGAAAECVLRANVHVGVVDVRCLIQDEDPLVFRDSLPRSLLIWQLVKN